MLWIHGTGENEIEINGRSQVFPPGPVRIIVGWRGSSHGHPAEGVNITMRYSGSGVWLTETSQLEKTVPLAWTVTVTSRVSVEKVGIFRGRNPGIISVAVGVDCPDDTPVEIIPTEPFSGDDLFPF